MSLKWKKVSGGYEAEVKNSDPKKRVSYLIQKHSFLGMATNSYDVSKVTGYLGSYKDIATKVSGIDAAKAVAESDSKRG